MIRKCNKEGPGLSGPSLLPALTYLFGYILKCIAKRAFLIGKEDNALLIILIELK